MNTESSQSFEKTTDAAIGINILLGLWIIFSPFLLAFRHLHPAVWNNVAIGFLVAVISGIRVSVGYNHPGWSWCTALFGVWLIISPFALGFATTTVALWNNIIVGAVVGLLSWRGAAERGLRGEATSSA